MKKFLTVLLALSVVFTYSFSAVGSVFAAEKIDKATVITQAEKEASDQLDKIKVYAKEWRETLSYGPATDFDTELGYKYYNLDGTYYFTATDIEKLCTIVNDEAKEKLAEEVTKIVSKDYATQDELTVALSALKTVADGYESAYATKVTALEDLDKLELMYAQERYTKYVDSIEELDYSDVPNEAGVIIRDEVKKLKEQAKLDIANATAPFSGNTAARTIANTLYTALQNKTLYPTIKDEESSIEDLDDAIAYYTAKIEAEILAQKAQVKYDLNEALKAAKRADKVDTVLVAKLEAAVSEVDDNFANVVKAAKGEISLQKTPEYVKSKYEAYSAQAKKFTVANIYDADYQLKGNFKIFVNRAETVAALEAKAAEMKTKTGFDGTPLYSADAIDKALKDDLALVYTGGTAKYLDAVKPSEDQVKAEMNRVLYGGTVIVDKIKYPTVSAWAADENKYDDVDTFDEVEAIVKETVSAIRAAKTVADVDAAFLAGYEKFDAVASDADKDAYQKTVAGNAAVTKYTAKLAAELVGKKADYGNAKFAEDFDIDDTAFIVALAAKYLKVAYNDADLETKYQDAVKEITNLKNKAELKAEATAINAAIAELSKKTLTASDEEEVLSLVERENNLKKYIAMIGAKGSYITYGMDSYKAKMQALVKTELDAAKKAIGTVTVEDAAAIAELVAKAEAYKENYNIAYNLGTLEDDLLTAQIKAVEKAIGAIDASADPLDTDAIKAAREAYDALGEVTIDSTMYHKLLSLENLANDYVIKSVESLKISVSTKLYTKSNKIRVNWKVKDGDASAITGYQVYKSTKAHTNYKYMGKTTKSYMDNKKNLKKGQRYFYKVRAYVEIDGQKYYSDWSNKGNRIYK